MSAKKKGNCMNGGAGISLNESMAESRISDSFEVVLSPLFSRQPLFLSQDQVSLAEETGLGVAVICTSRSARGEKSQTF